MSKIHFRNASDKALITLFGDTFTASEGADEGQTIAGFVERMLLETGWQDLRIFATWDGPDLVGAALFSRLTYAEDDRNVMILSPMAVLTARQGEGIGQSLIAHALEALKREGIDVTLTYGDPNFYSKAGFKPLSLAQAAAPLPLSYPEGWIGQTLTGGAFEPLKGTCVCVAALNDPALW